jgi:hypothetical protein
MAEYGGEVNGRAAAWSARLARARVARGTSGEGRKGGATEASPLRTCGGVPLGVPAQSARGCVL